MRCLYCLVALLCLINFVNCQNSSTDSEDENSVLRKDWSYCFEFTWFGPGYDNITGFNSSCSDYIDNTRAGKSIPCSPPAVISYDGSPPDIDWLFENKRESVLCRRTSNQVCVRYTYKYNGVVSNTTYMCTKVQEVGGSAITSGFYSQAVEGYDIEMHVCTSDRGYAYKPCNGVSWPRFQSWLILIAVLLIMY